MITDTSYDVFVSYDSRDRPFVAEVVEELEKRKCSCFFDQRHLRKGFDWVVGLEEALEASRSVAVFLGPHGMGGWQQRERAWALDRQIHHPDYPVIPAVLPNSDPPRDFLKLLTWVEFRDGPKETAQLDRLAAAIRGDEVQQLELRDPRTGICPYRGLNYFREEDASFFFGRDAYVEKLAQMVAQRTLVAVMGDSGSGKSSVVRAGLIPRLRLPGDGPVWEIATMVPGDDPLESLADVILPLVEPELAGWDLARKRHEAAEDLRDSKVSLSVLVSEALRQQKGTDRLLLVVDQWEELCTLCDDSQLRDQFIKQLLNATSRRQSPLSVVLTVRADFYCEIVKDRGLLDSLEGGFLHLGPMNREELQAAIEKPAANVGLTFQDGLVERLLEDARDEPGQLPLLEFALEELWKRQSGGQLTHSAYEELGRLSGAIATRAETIYARLDEAQQEVVPGLFRRLVRAGAKTEEDTRRRADFHSLSETSQRVARLFADKRLLVTTLGSRSASAASATQAEGDSAEARDETGQPGSTGEPMATETVEVAHEELLRRWGRLKQWVDKDRKFLQWRARLAPLLEQYHRDAKSALLRHGALREARQFYPSRTEELEEEERSFVQASLRAEVRRKQRLWGLVVVMVVALAGVYLWVRINSARDRVNTLLGAAPQGVETALDDVKEYRWLAARFFLHGACNNPELTLARRLHAAFGIAEFDRLTPDELEMLLSGIPRADARERDNYFRALEAVRPPPTGALLRLADKAKSLSARGRYALTLLSLGIAEPAKQMAALAEDPSPRTELIHNWGEWPLELRKLPQLLRRDKSKDAFCSAICCGLGLLDPNTLDQAELGNVVQALQELHCSAPGVATHGSSGWALRQWKAKLPQIVDADQPDNGRDWYVINTLEMTMLKIPKGTFFRRDEEADYPNSQKVTLTDAFYLSDREVSVAQFQAFIRDPDAEKPDGWKGPGVRISLVGKHPVQRVNWFDAVLFCNWLSGREGLTPCYKRTKEGKEIIGRESSAWEPIPKTNGYRLPTEAEWEHACRARSRTPFYFGGDDLQTSKLLSKYAVVLASRAVACGSRIPNGWGLFDMHGNVWEWCQDWYKPYPAKPSVTNPLGPPTGSLRVYRGGSWLYDAGTCRSANRIRGDPSDRLGSLGFRVARSLPGPTGKSESGADN